MIYWTIYQCSTPSVNCEPILDLCIWYSGTLFTSGCYFSLTWPLSLIYNVFFWLSPTWWEINATAFMFTISRLASGRCALLSNKLFSRLFFFSLNYVYKFRQNLILSWRLYTYDFRSVIELTLIFDISFFSLRDL